MDAERKQQLRMIGQFENELEEIYHNYALSYNLSDTAFWLLYIIWDMGDGCTQSDICETWFYKRQSINSALKKLQVQGHLILKAVPGNRKSKQIVLTEAGKELAEKVITLFVSAEIETLKEFDEQERNLFIELTKKRLYSIRQNIMKIMPNVQRADEN